MQRKSRDVLEKVDQGWAVTKLGSRPSQAFPRGAAAADDDGRRLADCVGSNNLQQFLLPPATWDQAATNTLQTHNRT